MTRTIATICSGGGGVEVGAMAAGLTPLWGVEIDPMIASVYQSNIGPHVLVQDAPQVDYGLLPTPDVLHVSPECTRASQAKSGGQESDLDLSMAAAIVRALRFHTPRLFSLENVIPYRSFQSYRLICQCLSDLGYIWHAEHVNSADFGVPQTRRRLILRASRDGLLRGLPQAERWIGWYEAIEDLIPTLPASRFAPWQLARLPAEVSGSFYTIPQQSDDKTGSEYGYGCPRRSSTEPALTVTATQQPAWYKAFIVDGMPNDRGESVTVRHGDEPMMTVSANGDKRKMRAFFCDPSNTSRDATLIDEASPSMSVQAWHGRRPSHMPLSWLSQGRVVAMTPRALARFQSVPDSYVLPQKAALACRVIGNMVPCRLYQRIVESLL